MRATGCVIVQLHCSVLVSHTTAVSSLWIRLVQLLRAIRVCCRNVASVRFTTLSCFDAASHTQQPQKASLQPAPTSPQRCWIMVRICPGANECCCACSPPRADEPLTLSDTMVCSISTLLPDHAHQCLSMDGGPYLRVALLALSEAYLSCDAHVAAGRYRAT